MLEPIRFTRRMTFCSLLLLLVLQFGGSVLANPCLRYPSSDGCTCIPNAMDFGHFRPAWREWPCERRPDKTFPRSIGVEAIPTPAGQEQLPLPRGMIPPGGEGATDRVPAESPAEGGILPEGGIRIDEGTPDVPEPPSSLQPGPADRLPGLPLDLQRQLPAEPIDENRLPATPEDDAPSPEIASKPTDGGAIDQQQPSPSARAIRHVIRQAGVELEVKSVPGKLEIERPQERPISSATYQSAVEAVEAEVAPFPPEPKSQQPEKQPGSHVAQQPMAELQAESAPRKLKIDRPGEQPTKIGEDGQQIESCPVALDGYCPVELGNNERWVEGDSRWSAVHQGRMYLLSGPTQRKCFLADPDRYAPTNSEHDPVLTINESRNVPGQTDYCVTYNGRLYMFSSETTLARFRKHPKRYATAVSGN